MRRQTGNLLNFIFVFSHNNPRPSPFLILASYVESQYI